MIYLFRIISDEDQEFYRDLVIDSADTFMDFHEVLQENLGYDPSQLASFFITNENWEKLREITLIDMMQDPSVETLTMESVTLEEHVEDPDQRMIYVFDFFSERAFFIELIETSEQTSPRPTPFIAKERGPAPPQLALDMLADDPGMEEMPAPDSDEDYPLDDLRFDDLDPDMLGEINPDDY